jgi:hypothetical protein
MAKYEARAQAFPNGSRRDRSWTAIVRSRLRYTIYGIPVAVGGGAVLAAICALGLIGGQPTGSTEAAELSQVSLGLGSQLAEAKAFGNGLAPVKVGERWGYVNRVGRMVISPQFDDAESHSLGLAQVKVGERWGYINLSGQMVIPAQYDEALSFFADLGGVKVGERWGYINRTGQMVIPPRFERASTFYDNPAPVMLDGQWVFIAVNGDVVLRP